MSPVSVTAVDGGRERETFIALPYGLHRRDPLFTPLLRRDVRMLLDPARNPFFEHAEGQLFLARSAGKVVGRIAALRDRRHNDIHGERTGFFGFFDCVEDQAVAAALFEAVAAWLRPRRLDALRGPVSPSMNDEVGLLVEGFETPPTLMMPHNPRYYPRLVEGAGFAKAKDLIAFQTTDNHLPPRLVEATEIVRRRYGVTARRVDMSRFGEEIEVIKRLFDAAWEKNWGFVPLTDREIDHLARQLRPLVVPELVLFAERAGEPIGFAVALPDLNVALRANPSGRLFPGILRVLWAARKITRIRVLLLGTLPEWRGKGVDALLYRRIWEDGYARGYRWAEAGWILEDNHAMVNGLRRMGFEPYKTYRIYERPL